MIMIVFVFASCQEELEFENTETAQTPPNVLEQKKIQNGRFVFSSVSALEETIEELQKYDTKKIELEFSKFYEMGFRSHALIVNEDNEQLMRNKFRPSVYLRLVTMRNNLKVSI